jgi:hypothetical protein
LRYVNSMARSHDPHSPAPTYIDFVMSWLQKLLDDENVFPTKSGRSTCSVAHIAPDRIPLDDIYPGQGPGGGGRRSWQAGNSQTHSRTPRNTSTNRVEVRLDGQVEDLLEMRVVNVRKDPEEVFVDVFRGVRE